MRSSGKSTAAASISARLLFVVLVALWVHHSVAEEPRVRRARRPEFSPEVREAFFPDAREKLVGPRPAAPQPSTLAGRSAAPTSSNANAPAPTSVQWSAIISAESVEDEIKARQPLVAAAVENVTRFKSGEYQVAQSELALLAVMLGVVAEYDGNIRWKRQAAPLRDLVARAGMNCKVASDATFQEARNRADDLQTLIRGGSLSLDQQASPVDWPRLADRTLLMQRLDEALEQSIAPQVGSEQEFQAHATELLHEAEIVAALAEVITREGYEFADDETYLEYSRAMQQHARDLRGAVLDGAYEKARRSAGELRQSCTNCHDGYRG